MNMFPAPEDIYQELFQEVHQAGILADGKSFSDALPKAHPEHILASYRKEKQAAAFDLEKFLATYFSFPQERTSEFQADLSRSPREHIEVLWEYLTRKADEPVPGSSLIPLPYPYIVPGGRFNEIYYWDSYFTQLGLQQSGRIDMVKSMIRNFSYFIDQFGFIPNGNRSYFLSRSQPPFYACMVSLLAEERGEKILVEYLPFLKKEHAFWMHENGPSEGESQADEHVVRLKVGGVLNRYWDQLNRPRAEMYGDDLSLFERTDSPPPEFYRHIRAACESGWDFSSRWLRDPQNLGSIHTLDILPVDLNCLLWKLETLISRAYKVASIPDQAENYALMAHSRKRHILDYFWDNDLKYFTDYDFKRQQSKGVLTLAGMYPLFFELASPLQAEHCAAMIRGQFLRDGGLLTSTCQTGQQWDAPNGWAPLQWIAIQGLRNYGFTQLAEEIRQKWITLVSTVYQRTGKMLEKYNVEDLSLEGGGGEYPVQDGFGWTNGVFLKLLEE